MIISKPIGCAIFNAPKTFKGALRRVVASTTARITPNLLHNPVGCVFIRTVSLMNISAFGSSCPNFKLNRAVAKATTLRS